MTAADDITVKLAADISKFTGSMGQVHSSIVSVEKAATKSSLKMTTQLSSIGRLFKLDVVLRYASGIARLSGQMEKQADALEDVAQRANISVEALQRLDTVARENGSSAEVMDLALIRLQKSLGGARSGSKQLQEVFEALGLERLVKSGATTEEAFYALADAVADIGDKSQAAKILMDLLGRSGDELTDVMSGGSVQLRAVADSIAATNIRTEELNHKLAESHKKTEQLHKFLGELAAMLDGAFLDALEGSKEFIDGLIARWDSFSDAIMGVVRALELIGGQDGVDLRPPSQKSSQFGSVVLSRPSDQGFQAPASTTSTQSVVDAASPFYSGVKDGKVKNLYGSSSGAGAASKAMEDAKNATKQYEEAVSDLNFQIEQLARSEKDAAYQEELRSALSSAGVAIDTARGESIALLVSQMRGMVEAQEAIAEADAANAEAGQKWIDMKAQAGDAVASAFERAIIEGESLRETFSGLLKDLAKMIFQKMVFEAISGAVSGGLGGFAMGGGVNPGNPYMVGEAGPELFVPKVPGTIVPNRGLGGGRSVVINSVVNAGGGVNKAELQSVLNQRDRQLVSMFPKLMVDKQRRNGLGGAFG